jgi:molybdate transport repressor ModE-like protein
MFLSIGDLIHALSDISRMDLEPRVALVVNGADLTPHQLEVVHAIYRHGSQRSAARSLGITTPVLNRYVRQIEAKTRLKLAESTPSGTVLTPEGEKIAREYAALQARLAKSTSPVVGCTIITEDLLLSSLSKVDPEGRFDLIISDDQRNLKDFRAGLMDLVVLDDPLNAFDESEALFEEIGFDRLLHVDRGPCYLRFRYGAQRIGFKHLEASGRKFQVERTERSLTALVRSNLSFFVNESLAARKGLKLKSDTDPRLLRHEIIAIYREERADIASLLLELKKERALGTS